MARVVFNPDTGGVGDFVVAAWLAEGLKHAGHEALFHTSHEHVRHLVRVFSQTPITAAPGEPMLLLGHRFPQYSVEMSLKGTRRRVDVWAEGLPGPFTPRRPPISISPNLRKWAALEQAKTADGKPIIGIFPFANYKPRTWPLDHWITLAQKLQADGYKVWAFVQGRHKNLLPPGILRYWNFRWDSVAALLERCSLVIGNDSGGAHVAGTLGRRTLAICGPSRNVFSYCPETTEIRVDEGRVPCSGCHFHVDNGFRDECNRYCHALDAFTPDMVYRHVQEALACSTSDSHRSAPHTKAEAATSPL